MIIKSKIGKPKQREVMANSRIAFTSGILLNVRLQKLFDNRPSNFFSKNL
jgi:hypothetical protein